MKQYSFFALFIFSFAYLFMENDSLPKESDNSPVLFETMLHFKDKNQVSEFIKQIDKEVDNFDYSKVDDDSYDYGDPLLDNIIDKKLQFKSLRLKYDILEDKNDGYTKDLPFYIPDPDLKLILNENHEIRIGRYIYKYMSRDIIAQISRADLKCLNEVRQLGLFATNSNVKFINEFTKEPITIINVEGEGEHPHPDPDPDPGSRACVLSFPYSFQTNVNGDYNFVDLNMGAATGNGSLCISNYKIEWGDGSAPETTINDRTHIYPEITTTEGCNTYTIKITCTVLSNCGECVTGNTMVQSFTTTICKSSTNCTLSNHTNGEDYFFSSGGKDYRLKTEVGVRATDGFLTDEKVWAETKCYRRKNNKWKKKRPAKDLGVSLSGAVFNSFCNGKTNIPSDCSKYKHRRSVCVKYNPSNDIYLEESGAFEIKADFTAQMTSVTYGLYDFELYD